MIRKLLNLSILTIVLTFTFYISFDEVNAFKFSGSNILTSCGDGKYSVDKITGYDKFETVACYSESEFSQAYQKMIEISPNSVIRHNESNSPMNIVAADRALVYTQSETYQKSSTVNLYADKNLTSANNYLWSRMSAYYYQTEIKGSPTVVKPSDLVALIEMNGAKGYVSQNSVDIIPLIYVENRADMKNDGKPSWTITFFTIGYDANGQEYYVENRINPHITYYYSFNNTTIGKNELVVRIDTATDFFRREIGFAPSWMQAVSDIQIPTTKYYSPNGIDFYTDMDLKIPVKVNDVNFKLYNYYNYLPFRSKTNYSSSELNSYLRSFFTNPDNSGSVIINNEQLFIDAQNKYGMNALLIFSMGLLESNYGRSTYAKEAANLNGKVLFDVNTKAPLPYDNVRSFCTAVQNGTYIDENNIQRYCLGKNNIFGYGAYDSNPDNADAYISLKDGIEKQMGRNLRYYLDAMNTNQYSSSIGNKGVGINTRYASDPWWSVKIASIAYQVDRFLGFKDYDYYQLGLLKNDANRDFYSDYSLGTKLYSINQKASTYTVVVLEQNGDKYKVQSTNPIENSNTVIVSPNGSYMKPVDWTPTLTYKYSSETAPYDWANSFDYKTSSDITLINTAKNPIIKITGTDSLIIYTSKLEWRDNSIYVYGYSALRNTDMNVSSTSHILKFIELTTNEVKYSFPLSFATPEFPLNFLNGYDYSKAWFEGTIDMTGINPAYYRILLETSTSSVKSSDDLSNTDRTAPKPLPKNIGDSNYKFIFNNTERMRYELYIENGLSYQLQQTPLISRFYPVAFFNSFDVTDGLFSFEGIAYQIGNTTNQASGVEQKLILLSNDGTQHVFELNESAGKYNYSNGGNDYSFAWFDNSIDLKLLPIGDYKLFILNSSSGQIDSIEIRDYLGFKLYTSSFDGRKYTLTSDPKLKDKISLRIE